jgi:hypothetical protein
MKKYLWISLALVAAVGFAAAPAFARGGGGHGGGGHHGGGHHGGHHGGQHHANHHANHHAGHHHNGNHYHHSHWAHHNRPFSRGWYGRHGGAWGYGWGGWGWGNPWAISTLGATAAWLGVDAADDWGNFAYPANVYTSDNSIDGTIEDDEQAQDDTTVNQQQQQQPQQNQAIAPADQARRLAEAAALARGGATDPAKQTKFLPLGVFTLAPRNQTEASALVQLAVSKDGVVRGSYYDMLTDQDHPVRGAVDKKTGRVAFTFGPQGKVTFETSVRNLTQDRGVVGVNYENGKTSTWTLARYEKEPSENEADDQDEATEGKGSDAERANPTVPETRTQEPARTIQR